MHFTAFQSRCARSLHCSLKCEGEIIKRNLSFPPPNKSSNSNNNQSEPSGLSFTPHITPGMRRKQGKCIYLFTQNVLETKRISFSFRTLFWHAPYFQGSSAAGHWICISFNLDGDDDDDGTALNQSKPSRQSREIFFQRRPFVVTIHNRWKSTENTPRKCTHHFH